MNELEGSKAQMSAALLPGTRSVPHFLEKQEVWMGQILTQ